MVVIEDQNIFDKEMLLRREVCMSCGVWRGETLRRVFVAFLVVGGGVAPPPKKADS